MNQNKLVIKIKRRIKMKENFLQILFATVAGAIVAYLNVLLVPLVVLVIVMLIDYVTGMAQAYLSHTLNSRIGVVGIIKKISYITAVVVGIVADYLISSALTQVGIDIKINYCIGMIVTIWFIINELISVLENLAEIGIPLPKFLVSIVKRLKVVVENKTTEDKKKDDE
jgi:toxin secretion/phage lysis holin